MKKKLRQSDTYMKDCLVDTSNKCYLDLTFATFILTGFYRYALNIINKSENGKIVLNQLLIFKSYVLNKLLVQPSSLVDLSRNLKKIVTKFLNRFD